MPSSNPVDYGADPCGLRNSAWAINECLTAAGRCDFPEGTFLLGSSPGAKIIDRFRFNNVAAFTTATPHNLVVGEKITLYGFSDPTFNGTGAAQLGFVVDSTPSPTTFTATVPGPNSLLVVEDGWINLIGGGYTSSIVLGYQGVLNNVAFTGKGPGKTILKFADHTSTKRGDTFGFNIQMLKTLGNYAGFGVVGAPGAYPGVPVNAANCKNTIIEGITFDGNYTNNSVADIKITAVERINGINTYYTAYPHFISSQAPPSYTPPVIPAPYTNVSQVNQYISNVVTAGPGNDSTFVGFGQVVNITPMSFQRDLRVVLVKGEINASNFAIFTRHPQWNFGFTINDSVTVTGFTNPTLNGTFTVLGFLSPTEFYCTNANPAIVELTTAARAWAVDDIYALINYERLSNVAIYDSAVAHPFTIGDIVTISGFSDPSFNGTFTITATPSPSQFKCANVGPDTGVFSDFGNVTVPQTSAGVNSTYTVAGINHVGENALFQNNQFYDFGVGVADAETFLLKSFLPMTVDNLTKGATVRNTDFGYQGRNSIQSTLYPGNAEANTQCAIGGYSSLINNINVVSRAGGVATYTCVMKHTLRVGDVVAVAGFSNPSFNGTLTVLSTPDAFRFTATTGGPNILPGLYLDGTVTMLRSQRIFAGECVFEYNKVRGGPNPVNQQSPVVAVTVRETDGADIRYNNFDGFTGTCFYVDSYHHYRTRIRNNSALNISAFVALTVQDWYTLIVSTGDPSAPLFSVLTAAHKSMRIENNDVLLTGPNSWYFQTANPPIDAVFLINNHDVDRSQWYYPTDYQIPIDTPSALPVGASRNAAGISTFTTKSSHELQPGMKVSVIGVNDGTFNGVFTVLTVPAANQFTVNNQFGPLPNTPVTSGNGFVGINEPIQFPWEIRPIGFQRTAGVATYTTNKAHHLQLNWHATVEGFSDPTFNDEVIVTGTPTPTTFTCANPGPDVAFTSEVGNFFRYVDDIQISCNVVRRLSGNGLVINNGGRFGGSFLPGRPTRCVAPLDQFFYFDCPEGCLALECDPGPCKPNDYTYRI